LVSYFVCFNPCLALLTEISELWLCTSVIKKIKTVNREETSTSLFRIADWNLAATGKNLQCGHPVHRQCKQKRRRAGGAISGS
jgi:hypothetical protein